MKLCDQHHKILDGTGDCLVCELAALTDHIQKLKSSQKQEIAKLKARITELESRK